jgi:hypothetical protein
MIVFGEEVRKSGLNVPNVSKSISILFRNKEYKMVRRECQLKDYPVILWKRIL